MKKILLSALVIASFASCNFVAKVYTETHTFKMRHWTPFGIVTDTKVVTSTDSYCRGQLVRFDGEVWECQN